MSLFYQLFDEHKDWLEAKEYGEEFLSSPERPGRLFRQLKSKLSEVTNDRYSLDEERFTIETTGWFNEGKDTVRFEFHYSFDTKKQELNLLKLVADMGVVNKTYPIDSNNRVDLPDSYTVFEELIREKIHKVKRQFSETPGQTHGKKGKTGHHH